MATLMIISVTIHMYLFVQEYGFRDDHPLTSVGGHLARTLIFAVLHTLVRGATPVLHYGFLYHFGEKSGNIQGHVTDATLLVLIL